MSSSLQKKPESTSIKGILQRHFPMPLVSSPVKSPLLSFQQESIVPKPAKSPLKPRTIEDIAKIQEPRLGNQLDLDEFGDQFEVLSIARKSAFSKKWKEGETSELWTGISPEARRLSHPKGKGIYNTFDLESIGEVPGFEEIARFLSCEIPLNPSLSLVETPSPNPSQKSPSLTDSDFLPLPQKQEPSQTEAESSLSPEAKTDPGDIDEKLHELLDICRPLSSAALEPRNGVEELLNEVQEKLKYVKEERNILKAKLILKFLTEYKKAKDGREIQSDDSETDSNPTQPAIVPIDSGQYFYTPPQTPSDPSKSEVKSSEKSVASKSYKRKTNPPVKDFARTQKVVITRSKSPVPSHKKPPPPKPSFQANRSSTPTRVSLHHRKVQKQKILAQISTPKELFERLMA